MNRREWLAAAGLLMAAGRAAHAQPGAPLRLGADGLIDDTGLGPRWQAAMVKDLGLRSQWSRLPTSAILRQMEAGLLDVGLFLSHPEADRLERQGLIHDRHELARMKVVLVGPVKDPAGLRGEPDVARALQQILAGQAAGACRWEAPRDDSPLAGLAATLMRHVATQSLPARGGMADPQQPAYRLLAETEWRQWPRAQSQALKVVNEGDPRLWLSCLVARSFRSPHSAGKLLVQWLQGPVARRAVASSSHNGWLPPQS